jgi:hypothetical protein
MVAHTTASKKAKGRNFQKQISNDIISTFPELTENDVVPTTSSVSGIDIRLSEIARKTFPYGIEAKNQETVSIWSWIQQAELNASAEHLTPAVIFKRNRSDPYIVLKWKDFLSIIKK